MASYTIIHNSSLQVIACNNPIISIDDSLGSVPGDWSSGDWADQIQSEFQKCLTQGGFVVPKRQFKLGGKEVWYRLRLDRTQQENDFLIVSTAAILPDAITELSPAELEVFNQCVMHLCDRNTVAQALSRSPNTIKTHIQSIRSKFNMSHEEFVLFTAQLPR